jgi:hypothetical protein
MPLEVFGPGEQSAAPVALVRLWECLRVLWHPAVFYIAIELQKDAGCGGNLGKLGQCRDLKDMDRTSASASAP